MTVAALDDSLGWRDEDIDPVDGKAIIRVILLVTDALFQYTQPAVPGLSSCTGAPGPAWAPGKNTVVTANYDCFNHVCCLL